MNFIRTNTNRPFHRRRQSLRHCQVACIRHRLQAVACALPLQGSARARALLHGAHRGPGVFLDQAADRLARLQRLHHGRSRPRNSSMRWVGARSRATWISSLRSMPWSLPTISIISCCSRRRRFPLACRGASAQGQTGQRRFHAGDNAADGRRRASPPSRPIHRSRQSAKRDRPRSVRAGATRAQARRTGRGVSVRRSDRNVIFESGARACVTLVIADAVPSRPRARRPRAGQELPALPAPRAFREENRRAHPDWFNGAVPSFGSEDARLLIVGLAPGLKAQTAPAAPSSATLPESCSTPLCSKRVWRAGATQGRARGASARRLHDRQCRALRAAAEQADAQGSCNLPPISSRRIEALPNLIAPYHRPHRPRRDPRCASVEARRLSLRSRGAPRSSGRAHPVRHLSLLPPEHEYRAADEAMFEKVVTEAAASLRRM